MKNLLTLFTFILSIAMFPQDFSGKATYQTKMIIKDFKENENQKTIPILLH